MNRHAASLEAGTGALGPAALQASDFTLYKRAVYAMTRIPTQAGSDIVEVPWCSVFMFSVETATGIGPCVASQP